MNIIRFKVVALLCLVISGPSLAIGVGNMTVTSYINQPLQANIAVLQPDGLVEAEAPTIAEQPTQLVQPASESGSANFSGWLWIVAVIGILALSWFNRHRLMAGGLDDLVPVPSKVLSSGDDAQREHAQSLLDSLE